MMYIKKLQLALVLLLISATVFIYHSLPAPLADASIYFTPDADDTVASYRGRILSGANRQLGKAGAGAPVRGATVLTHAGKAGAKGTKAGSTSSTTSSSSRRVPIPPPQRSHGAKPQLRPAKAMPKFETDFYGETYKSKFGRPLASKDTLIDRTKQRLLGEKEMIPMAALFENSNASFVEEYSLARQTHLDAIRATANDVLEPKGSKIVLLTASDGKGHNSEIKDLFRNVNENREDYCAYHNYTYQFSNITKYQKDGRPAVWGKIPAIIEAFQINPDAEWVWWLDTDAIIMTPTLDLASLVLNPEVMQTRITAGKKIRLPNGKTSGYNVSSTIDPSIVDLVVAQDHHGVNAGSFMIRRSEWTAQFLSLWQDPQFIKANYERLEQDALNKIITSNPEMQKHVAFVDLRLINAFSVGADDMGWITGDLVVHFAGCWVTRECDSRWRDFWRRRKVIKPSPEALQKAAEKLAAPSAAPSASASATEIADLSLESAL